MRKNVSRYLFGRGSELEKPNLVRICDGRGQPANGEYRQMFRTQTNLSFSSLRRIDQENKYAASNYASLPVVISRAEGVHMYDPNGKQYFDFLSAYSAVNQGHQHPKIVRAAIDQLQV